MRLRLNVLVLSVVGALLVIGLAILLPQESVAVIALGGGLIGAVGGVMRELVAPPPEDPPQEVDTSVPLPAVLAVIDIVRRDQVTAHEAGRHRREARVAADQDDAPDSHP